jgi:hypothetical protein
VEMQAVGVVLPTAEAMVRGGVEGVIRKLRVGSVLHRSGCSDVAVPRWDPSIAISEGKPFQSNQGTRWRR